MPLFNYLHVAPPNIINHTEATEAYPVILSSLKRNATLECIARSYPAGPEIMWELSNGTRTWGNFENVYTGGDGAVYARSQMIVAVPGNYSCFLNSTEKRHFVVVGKITGMPLPHVRANGDIAFFYRGTDIYEERRRDNFRSKPECWDSNRTGMWNNEQNNSHNLMVQEWRRAYD